MADAKKQEVAAVIEEDEFEEFELKGGKGTWVSREGFGVAAEGLQ